MPEGEHKIHPRKITPNIMHAGPRRPNCFVKKKNAISPPGSAVTPNKLKSNPQGGSSKVVTRPTRAHNFHGVPSEQRSLPETGQLLCSELLKASLSTKAGHDPETIPSKTFSNPCNNLSVSDRSYVSPITDNVRCKSSPSKALGNKQFWAN